MPDRDDERGGYGPRGGSFGPRFDPQARERDDVGREAGYGGTGRENLGGRYESFGGRASSFGEYDREPRGPGGERFQAYGTSRGWDQQDYGSAAERERFAGRGGVDRGWDQPQGRGYEPDRDRAYGASPGGFARSQGYGGSQRGYESSLHDAGDDRGPSTDRTSRSFGYGPPAQFARPREGQPNYAGRGPKNWKRSDDRVMEDVSDLLERHPGIDASEVEVQVRDGVVTLNGTVPQREMKRMAEDIIESVAGVQDVENHVRVARDIGFSTNADGLMVQGAARATRGNESAPSSRPAQAGTPAEAREVSPPQAGTQAGTPAQARSKSR
jgi:hypothetical protein